MRAFGNRLGVLEKRALEKHVREGHQQRLFINRREHALERHSDPVVRLHGLDSQIAISGVRFVNIHHRREVQFGIDNLVSLWCWLETGEDERLADRNILMHHHCAWIRANDAPHFVAHRDRHIPPTFSPRAHATRGPNVSVFMQPIVRCTRHRAETVRD